jgi:dTDP-4-amino-4,6-dideoxygalactose transaminase
MATQIAADTLAVGGGTPVRTRPFLAWPVVDARDEAALLDVLRSGAWGARRGGRGEVFAQTFARYQDAAHGVAVSNGTAALEVALRAVGVEPLDEVIVPPYTFVASATAVLSIGAIPVFCDIREDTLLIDADDAAQRITPRTKAILPVHVAGQPADMDAVLALARRHHLRVVEDAAQAHGAAWRGNVVESEAGAAETSKKVGAIGDAGTFSFQSSKNLTGGEGGIVVTDDRGVAERAWSLANVGRIPEGAWYQHELMGWNLRLTEFQAALLLAQFARLPEQFERREANARTLDRELGQIDGIHPQARDARVAAHAHHLYAFRYDPAAWGGRPRDWFLKALRAEGVPVSAGYTTPLYRMNAIVNERRKWADLARRAGIEVTCPTSPDDEALPVAERVCREQGAWLTQNLLLGEAADTADIVAAFAKLRRAV